MKTLQIFVYLVAVFALVIADSANNTTTTVLTTTVMTTMTTMHSTAGTTPLVPTVVPSEPKDGDWNGTCILLKAGIRLTINYNSIDTNNKTRIVGQSTDVSENATAEGVCTGLQSIRLTFNKNWTLTFTFNKTGSDYSLIKLNLDYHLKKGQYPFPNATKYEESHESTVMNVAKVKVNMSYRCTKHVEIFNANLNSTTIGLDKVEFYNVQFQAYRSDASAAFGEKGADCEMDEISNLVPIIVGAALGGLILIVLIAYLIGRRRSKRGYESV